MLIAVAGASPPSFAATTSEPHRHVMVSVNVHHDVSAPLRDLKPSPGLSRAYPAKRVPGPPGPVVHARDTSGQHGLPRIPAPSVNFDGITANGSAPPHTQAAAGATQYFQMANTEIAVYTKSGGVIIAPENTKPLCSR